MTVLRRWWAPSHPAQLLLGLTLWSLWFVVLYGGLSVACALAPPRPGQGAFTAINGGLALLTLATLALLGWLAWRGLRAGGVSVGGSRFIALTGAGLHLFSAAGVAFVGLPIVTLPPCL
ncbi:hypothetical protein BDK63_002812 [Halomonas campaniensis]|uniref:Uncharacterized protein n=1 Tax=Halomonas campaniensis TaxID=213554 RepID=A0A7W5K4Q2_9GAMM|nr:hypothetical protein [Halomonas campaniensis]MBB3331921.1 hypothetical protein [Halomonas campaniensis]